MGNHKPSIPELSDADFLSFLYAERDRENKLSQYQGWNNWALAGAIVTVLCALYTTIKGSNQINWIRTVYYATGSISFFLAYHTWLKLLSRERGHDYYRVRLLKEMTPWVDSALSVLSSSCSIVLILTYDYPSLVFWLWLVSLLIQIAVICFALFYRNRLVPFYYYRPYFPRLYLNLIYNSLSGVLFYYIWLLSYKSASWDIFCPEFEIGLFSCTVILLFYFLIRINVENKVVKQFDAIVDQYLYIEATKEETFKKILCNRMGYGILDVCKKDMSKVCEMTKTCNQITKELEGLQTILQNQQYDIYKLPEYQRLLDNKLRYTRKSILQAKKLSSRLHEMLNKVPALHQVTEIDLIFKTNDDLLEIVNTVHNRVNVLITLVEDEYLRYYCKKSNTLCFHTDCIHKNDSLDKKYEQRLRRKQKLV